MQDVRESLHRESKVLSVNDLTIRLGSTVALSRVSFSCREGATGLLGPNGAGKSTLIKVALGLLKAATGSVEVLGERRSARALRQLVGYMPEHDGYIPGMSGVTFVAYMGELCGLTRPQAMGRAHEVLYYVGLGEARYRPVETYSTGMKQRVKLAQAIVHDPPLLFLDEPTNGLDPAGRREMIRLVADMAKTKGISILLSSHLLNDVETVCRDVVVLHRGKVARQGAIEELTVGRKGIWEVRVKGDPAPFVESLRRADVSVEDLVVAAEGASLTVVAAGEGPASIVSSAVASGCQLRHLRQKQRTLEEVFDLALQTTSRGQSS